MDAFLYTHDGVIFFIAGGINIANEQIPMVMSLGTTRKEAAWGVIIAMHGTALQFWILTIVYNAFLPPTYVVDSYVKVCGVLFYSAVREGTDWALWFSGLVPR